MDQASRSIVLFEVETAAPVESRRCCRCKEVKPVSEFHAHRTRGFQSSCKPCQLAYNREYQEIHAERLKVKREQAHLLAATGALAGTKVCKTCGAEKPLLEFYAHRDTKDRRTIHCKACSRQQARERHAQGIGRRTAEQSREYHIAHRERHQETARAWRVRMYGLTVDQYEDMVQKQDGRCAICGQRGEGTGRPLGIDHCHETNVVRGLLCNFCNSMLGFARDQEDILLRAVEYLRSSRMEEAG